MRENPVGEYTHPTRIHLNDSRREPLDSVATFMKQPHKNDHDDGDGQSTPAAAPDEEATMDSETLDAIDQAEDDIKHGRVYDWADVRAWLETQFP
jgi:hypothetical protein